MDRNELTSLFIDLVDCAMYLGNLLPSKQRPQGVAVLGLPELVEAYLKVRNSEYMVLGNDVFASGRPVSVCGVVASSACRAAVQLTREFLSRVLKLTPASLGSTSSEIRDAMLEVNAMPPSALDHIPNELGITHESVSELMDWMFAEFETGVLRISGHEVLEQPDRKSKSSTNERILHALAGKPVLGPIWTALCRSRGRYLTYDEIRALEGNELLSDETITKHLNRLEQTVGDLDRPYGLKKVRKKI